MTATVATTLTGRSYLRVVPLLASPSRPVHRETSGYVSVYVSCGFSCASSLRGSRSHLEASHQSRPSTLTRSAVDASPILSTEGNRCRNPTLSLATPSSQVSTPTQVSGPKEAQLRTGSTPIARNDGGFPERGSERSPRTYVRTSVFPAQVRTKPRSPATAGVGAPLVPAGGGVAPTYCREEAGYCEDGLSRSITSGTTRRKPCLLRRRRARVERRIDARLGEVAEFQGRNERPDVIRGVCKVTITELAHAECTRPPLATTCFIDQAVDGFIARTARSAQPRSESLRIAASGSAPST